MNGAPRFRVFFVSALALFVELALIRWLSCEIRVFAYFKNLILIACFLGFGLGFYLSTLKARLGTSLFLLTAIVGVVAVPARFDLTFGPQSAAQALSNFHGIIFMGGGKSFELFGPAARFVLGLAWTFSLFIASMFVLFGYVQLIGANIENLGPTRRLQAYSWNVAGSLVGILGFTFLCYVSMPPVVWFCGVFAATMPLLATKRARLISLVGLAFLAAVLFPRKGEVWSPYHKLEVSDNLISVNGTAYMALLSLDPKGITVPWDRIRLPHLLQPGARKVLVLGAGGGNDVSAALFAGAKEVVAVEIDPVIYRLGHKLHPDSPYSDPRVRVIVDDARHFIETTDERFDLIVLSHLDAHETLSGFTNVRLDNYIYTVESLIKARALLNTEGSLYLSFWAIRHWIATRLRENIRLAFGHEPSSLYQAGEGTVVHTHFMIGLQPRDLIPASFSNWSPPPGGPPPPLTDDWPYLFVRNHHIPTPMLIMAIPLVVMTTLILLIALRRRRDGDGRRFDRHFFFLGAGFLLLEVHNVSRLARVFGTTWHVNAWVITGVLLVILLANFIASRWPRLTNRRWVYALLLTTLLAAAVTPLESVIALPCGRILAALFYTVPLLFAGLIFAGSFKKTRSATRVLGANILGSILGGFLELSSFVIGLGSLLFVATALYALSYPSRADDP